MLLSLNGIYVNNDVFYIQFALKNKSQISYNIKAIRFFVRDKKKSKRTAVQETEIQSIYTYGNDSSIKGESSQLCVFALPKFTLPDDKYLFVQVTERDGGRDLHFRLKNRHIINAKAVENLF